LRVRRGSSPGPEPSPEEALEISVIDEMKILEDRRPAKSEVVVEGRGCTPGLVVKVSKRP
jgi:hypothetical protein